MIIYQFKILNNKVNQFKFQNKNRQHKILYKVIIKQCKIIINKNKRKMQIKIKIKKKNKNRKRNVKI